MNRLAAWLFIFVLMVACTLPAETLSSGLPGSLRLSAGQELAVQALLYYPENSDCTNNNFDQRILPGYRVSDDWGGAAWVKSGGKTAVHVWRVDSNISLDQSLFLPFTLKVVN